MSDRKTKARRKLLNLLSRAQLEELSQRGEPWRADRTTLIADALNLWDHDEVERAVKRLLADAA